MMFLIFWVLIFFLFIPESSGKVEIQIENISGTLRLQKEGSKKWIRSKKEKIHNNDILKTTSRSIAELKVNNYSSIFLGSNTKILVNIMENKAEKESDILNVTVFEGAVFSKIKDDNLKYNIYTFSSVISCLEKADFSVIVDNVSGKTGFQIFKGQVMAQNIALKDEQVFKKGTSTVISSNEPPSPAEAINSKQITVLSRYFGPELIDKETEEAGIVLVHAEESSTRMRRSGVKGEEAVMVQLKSEQDVRGRMEQLKSQGLITGENQLRMAMERLKEFDKKNLIVIKEPDLTDILEANAIIVGTGSRVIMAEGQGFLDFYIRPYFRHKHLKMSLNLPLVSYMKNGRKSIGIDFSGIEALLDKINFVQYRTERHNFFIGGIKNLTLGNGLVVNKYSNRHFSDYLESRGLYLKTEFGVVDFEGVVSDLSSNDVFMAHVGFLQRPFSLAFIYAGDLGQNRGYTKGDSLYRRREVFNIDNDLGVIQDVDVYEIDLIGEVVNRQPMKFICYASFAQMLSGGGNIGYGASIPGIVFNYKRFEILFEGLVTAQKFIPRYFDEFYEQNRAQIYYDSAEHRNAIKTMDEELFDNNNAKGVLLGGRYNICRDLTIAAYWNGNLLGLSSGRRRSSLQEFALSNFESKSVYGDIGMDFNLAMGKEFSKYIHLISIYYRKNHGDYFPIRNKIFEPNANTIWGGDFEFNITESITAGLHFKNYYIDTNGDNFINTANESYKELEFGCRVGIR